MYLFDRIMSILQVSNCLCFILNFILLSIDPKNSVSCVSIKVLSAIFESVRFFYCDLEQNLIVCQLKNHLKIK